MNEYQYFYLSSDTMSQFTLSDLLNYKNIQIIGKGKMSNNIILNTIFTFYLSTRINNIVYLPFKSFIYRYLFPKDQHNKMVLIITTAWLDKSLFRFLRRRYKDVFIIMRFEDIIHKRLQGIKHFSFEDVQSYSDAILCYDKKEVINNKFHYFPVGISCIDKTLIKSRDNYDVCFIGAAKDRLELIEEAYQKFCELNLKSFFYITGVPVHKRKQNGITYADKSLSYMDYLSYEISSNCLLEIIQTGTDGRTYRMMEAIMYKKKLITNCPEIHDIKFANHNVLFIKEINDITGEFFSQPFIDYQYNGEFSPAKTIEYIKQVIIKNE